MKKIFLLAVSSIACSLYAVTYKTSQTFMFTRPLFHSIYAQQQLWNDIINKELCSGDSTAQAIYVYQKSKPYNKNGAYFLLDCKPCIKVMGDDELISGVPAANQRDVRAEWLGLSDNFTGDLCLCPKQEEQGLFLEYNYNLGDVFGLDFFKSWWVDFFMPFVWVKNNSNPSGKKELIDSLNKPEWCGARITPKDLSKFGVPEIRLNLGTTLLNRDSFLFATYTGIAIPTVNKYPSTYLFSPLLGVNGHIAFISGLTMELPIYSNYRNSDIRVLFNAKNDWYLAHHQTRTFDLWNKPWSRYLQYRKEGEAETISGVNLFTRSIQVHPNNMFEIAAALRGKIHGFYVELGYSLWGHGDERLEYPDKKCDNQFYELEKYAIAGSTVLDDNRNPVYLSASASTISTRIDDPQDTFVTLKARDIFLCSANGRGGIVNKGEASLGYACQNNALLGFVGIGAYFESPIGNSLLKNRGYWAKAIFNF
jgi:hypothetical protein